MDYIVVRICARGGFELLDIYGKYVGCAPTLAHAFRVSEAEGSPLVFEADVWARALPEQGAPGLPPRLSEFLARIRRMILGDRTDVASA